MEKVFLNESPKNLEEYLRVVNGDNSINLDDDLDEVVEKLFLNIEEDYFESHDGTFIVSDVEIVENDILLHLYHQDYQSSVAFDFIVGSRDFLDEFKEEIENKVMIV